MSVQAKPEIVFFFFVIAYFNWKRFRVVLSCLQMACHFKKGDGCFSAVGFPFQFVLNLRSISQIENNCTIDAVLS